MQGVWMLLIFFHFGSYRFSCAQDEGTTNESEETTEGPCGGELTTGAYNLIKSPGYPDGNNPQGKYPFNTDCEWNYDGNEDTLILVKFWDLVVEIGAGNSNSSCEYDFVNVSISLLSSRYYCGYSAPEDVIIGFGSLFIHFHSDSSVSYRGFQLSYKITPDYDPCEPNPCVTGECGRTEDRVRPKCICDPGATGENCEIDINECESEPCQNGGTCGQDTHNEYACRCAIRWEGVNCEIEKDSPCSSSPCQNQGTCTANFEEFSFECECAEHYKGPHCEIADLPPCQSMPCLNGGTCDDLPNEVAAADEEYPSDFGGFRCACTKDWRDEICQREAGCTNPGIPYLEERKRFDEGSTVEFSCVEGFILTGPVNLTCFGDGSWSHSMPECISNTTSTDEDGVSTWLGVMIGLGVALAVKLVIFTFWMIYKGPWVKLDGENIELQSNFSLRTRSELSFVSDDVFRDDRTGRTIGGKYP